MTIRRRMVPEVASIDEVLYQLVEDSDMEEVACCLQRIAVELKMTDELQSALDRTR